MEKHIVSVLQDHDIPFKYEDIEKLLEQPETRNWVQKYLGEETLLSKEELHIYSKLENSPSLDSLLQSVDVASSRPVLDSEIEKAIESLNASTTAIENQAEALRKQCRELESQIQETTLVERHRTKATERPSTGHIAERQRIDKTIEDSMYDFEEKLLFAQKAVAADQTSLPSSTSALLKEHDIALRNMERVAASSQSLEDSNLIKQNVADLSGLLAKTMADEINHRLDRIYLETVKEEQRIAGDQPQSSDQIESLEAEVSSLYPEISVLSEMAAKQLFQTPLSRTLDEWQEQSQLGAEEQLHQILETMLQLTGSTEILTERINSRQCHHSALNTLAATYQSEVNRQTRKALSEKRLSRYSLRLSQAHPVSKTPDAVKEGSMPSLEGVLRRFGIPFQSLQNADSARAVNELLNEKRAHMLTELENACSTYPAALIPYLNSNDGAAQLLSSALYLESDFESTLVNEDQEQKMGFLETQIKNSQIGLQSLSTEVLHLSDNAREKFLERWV